MDKRGFSVGEMLTFGWEQWKKNWKTLLWITLVASIIPLIPQAFIMGLSDEALAARLILGLIYFVLSVLTQMGMLTIALKLARDESFSFSDFFSSVHLFPSYLWTKVLFFLSMVLGLMLFVVPGIIIVLMFSLWPFFVLDLNASGVDALKKSARATYGAKWDLFLFWLAAIGINILGLLFFGIGFLITWPVTLIAWARIYLTLERETHS